MKPAYHPPGKELPEVPLKGKGGQGVASILPHLIQRTVAQIPMSDDKDNPGPHDRARFNVDEDYEVAYWTKALDCTAEELKAAVKVVGVSADAVRAHLKKK